MAATPFARRTWRFANAISRPCPTAPTGSTDPLRTQITFRQGNLLQLDAGALPQPYDVLFCRNLLIYFDKPTTRAAIEKLSSLLADDGSCWPAMRKCPRSASMALRRWIPPGVCAEKRRGSQRPLTRRRAGAAGAWHTTPALRSVQRQRCHVRTPCQPLPRTRAGVRSRQRLPGRRRRPTRWPKRACLADRGQLREAGDRCHAAPGARSRCRRDVSSCWG